MIRIRILKEEVKTYPMTQRSSLKSTKKLFCHISIVHERHQGKVTRPPRDASLSLLVVHGDVEFSFFSITKRNCLGSAELLAGGLQKAGFLEMSLSATILRIYFLRLARSTVAQTSLPDRRFRMEHCTGW